MNKTIKFTSRKITKLEYIAIALYNSFFNRQLTPLILLWWMFVVVFISLTLNLEVIEKLLASVLIMATFVFVLLFKALYFSFGERVKNSQVDVAVLPEGLEIHGYYGTLIIKYSAIYTVKTFSNFVLINLVHTNNILYFIVTDNNEAAKIQELIVEYSDKRVNKANIYTVLNYSYIVYLIVSLAFIFIPPDKTYTPRDIATKYSTNVLTIDEIEYTKWRGKDIEMFLPSKIASTQTYYQIAGDMYPYIGNDGIIDNFPTQYQTSFSLEYGEMDVALLRVFVEDTASLNVDSVGRVNMTDTMLGLTLPQATCRTGDLELLTSGFSKREVGFCKLPQGTEVIGTATQYIKKISDTKYVVVFYFPNDYFDREMFEKFVLINIKPAL